jgi:tRNA (adenine37-N6)-methyltransferase
MKFEIAAIGFVKNNRKEISDDFWGNVISEIELTEKFSAESLKGLELFSHVEIIFVFNKVDDSEIQIGTAIPRDRADLYPAIGVFAQRKKSRPNKIGATICELIKIENKKIFVKGLDAIDATPVIDIKPVLKEFLPTKNIIQPSWMTDLMKDYWK